MKSVGRNLLHPETRENLRAFSCRGIPRSCWNIYGERTFPWMSRTCWSIWWLLQHRNGSALAFVFVLGRRVRAFIRGFLGLVLPNTPFTRSPHIYFIVVYLFRSTDDDSLSLIPLVHVVDQEETRYGTGHCF